LHRLLKERRVARKKKIYSLLPKSKSVSIETTLKIFKRNNKRFRRRKRVLRKKLVSYSMKWTIR